MIIIYIILIIIISGLILITRNYKQNFRNKINLKNLIFLSGLSMYLVDKLQKKIHILDNKENHKKLQKLGPDKEVKIKVYMFYIERVSLFILCMYCFLILGLFNCISIRINGNESVTTVQRPNIGEGKKTYDFVVVNESETKVKNDISITVDEHDMTNEEINEYLNQCYEKIISQIKGENREFQSITEDLNFIYVDMDFISTFYMVEDDSFINENGQIKKDKVFEYYEKNNVKSVDTSFTLVLSYGDINREFAQPITIKLNNKKKLLSYQISNKINESNSINKKKIILPDHLEGNKLFFYEKKEKETIAFLILGILSGMLMYVVKNEELKRKIVKRNQQLESDYASIVCKLTMLCGAGSTILLAWDKIISDYEFEENQYGYRYAYEEMKIARYRMKNGIPETEAYAEFGRRCDTSSYIKLGCLLEQNIKKGTKGLKDILDGEVREAFVERKLLAKKRGEEASTKLLFPMMLMLIISMVVVIVPAFMSMNL